MAPRLLSSAVTLQAEGHQINETTRGTTGEEPGPFVVGAGRRLQASNSRGWRAPAALLANKLSPYELTRTARDSTHATSALLQHETIPPVVQRMAEWTETSVAAVERSFKLFNLWSSLPNVAGNCSPTYCGCVARSAVAEESALRKPRRAPRLMTLPPRTVSRAPVAAYLALDLVQHRQPSTPH